MSRSHRANHFGTLFEKRTFDELGLEPARASWKDAEKDGDPWELKATMAEHADGNPGTFKVYEKYHRKLRRHDGWYCFGVYRPHGKGIRILKRTKVHSSQLPRLSWHGGGEHRGTRQAKIKIDEIFGFV